MGITFSRLLKLLKENNFNISIDKIGFIIGVFILSIRNSIFHRKDLKLLSNDNDKVTKPIFILGHWRSGTTFLHNLMIQDDQFNYPKIFEIIHPFTFLHLRKHYMDKIRTREVKDRPMDSVKNDPLLPGEEEFALAAMTLKSPIIGWAFPKRFDYYESYLTLEEISGEDRKLWGLEFNKFLSKVNNDSDKRLLLKSPANTARIKFLLELYPDAKFINIHRNPVDVFKSTKKLHETAIKTSNLQSKEKYDIEKRIISTYNKVYESYFNSVDLIPKNNFIDISFKSLEENPVQTINKIYKDLSLTGFENMKPKLEQYCISLKDYKKNKFKKLDNEHLGLIRKNWSKYYEKWGYNI